eukprot:2269649-Pleurochrysis_carterae.AAC.2
MRCRERVGKERAEALSSHPGTDTEGRVGLYARRGSRALLEAFDVDTVRLPIMVPELPAVRLAVAPL